MEPPYPNDYPHSITQHPHPGFRRDSFRSSSRLPSHPPSHPPTPDIVLHHDRAASAPVTAATAVESTPHLVAAAATTTMTTPTASSPLPEELTTTITHRHVPTTTHDHDVENYPTPSAAAPTTTTALPGDPYGLSCAYKTEQELAGLVRGVVANTSRKRSTTLTTSTNPPPFSSSARRARRLEDFYRTQNAAIERLLKPVAQHRADARTEHGHDRIRFRIAVWGSLAANVVLAALQLYAAVLSGSLSLYATMVDSVFDPLSNIMLIASGRAIRSVNATRFPAGKSRLETCANITFCFLMINVSWIIIAFAVRELATTAADPSSHGTAKTFFLPSVISVCCAFATKLALFLYCFTLRNRYSQVRILWQDHRNDLFVNGFGILTSVGGAKLAWWIDPAGATALSLLITFLWLRTAWAEFSLLVGVAAPPEATQLITYTCLTHSPAVKGIDTVRVYHSGPRLLAEVDIVMDPASSLIESHDVAESLQMKLESLPDIERCFVHVDYETSHSPEHSLKKDL